MALKITRQNNLIALIGAPTAAAAHAPGHERAPAALRAAGLVERLNAAGYMVNDLGDIEPQSFEQDDESPRARNIAGVLKALNALRPRVEEAAKSGALPLVLGGDCTIVLATVSGVRRYYRHVGLLYMDRHGDLNVPASTPSGRFAGMVLAHVVGRGAPELVRFWGEPPLVREPDVALFGTVDFDPYERDLLSTSPIRHYPAELVLRRGAAATALEAVAHIHSDARHFVLHLDADVISGEDFSASEFTGPGGLRLDDVRAVLDVIVRQKNLLAIEVTAYNPERDPDGAAAKMLVELIATALSTRLAALTAPPAEMLQAPAVASAAPVSIATESAAVAAAGETPIEESPVVEPPAAEESSAGTVPDSASEAAAVDSTSDTESA